MAITKRTEVDKMEILIDGEVQVRTATIIEEDGVELSRSFHRHVVEPDSDTTNEDPRVISVANSLHTPQVKAVWEAKKAAQMAEQAEFLLEGGDN
jgi:hypothetical protein